MSRRKRGLSPTLFPFLAVLVCTLGTLILLLVLVSQNATANISSDKNQTSTEDESTSLTQSQVRQLIREESFKLDELIAARELQTKDLEETRDQRTHLETHIQSIKERINYLRDEIEAATSGQAQLEISDEQLATARNNSKSLEETLNELKQDSENATPKFVIVPHQGPNGTDRRAIYLECNADGLTIWPEGSTITLEQLAQSNNTGNPLDAALRTIRLHALQIYDDKNAPYPLLIVRPNGIETYAAARRCMESWDDQFGYELIENSTELAFPPRDETLSEKIEQAIANAIQMQKHHAAGLSDPKSERNQKGTIKAANLPTLSAAAMERSSRANGYRQLSDTPYASSQFQPSKPNISDKNTRANYSDHTYPITSNNPSDATRHPSATPAFNTKTSDQSWPENGSNRPSYTSPIPKAFNTVNRDTGSLERTGGNVLSRGSSDNASYHGKSATTSSILNSGIPDDAQNSTNDGGASNTGPLTGEETGDDIESGVATRELTVAQSRNASDTKTNAITTNKGTPSPFAHSLSQGEMNGSSSSIGSAMEVPEQEFREKMPEPAIDPTVINAPPASRKLLTRAGSQWAIPSSAALVRGTAIVRKLQVEVYKNRFVLLASRQVNSIEIFSFFDGQLERASLQLATAIHDRILLWGPALPGGRWQPTIEVSVKSNADEAFAILKRNLAGSGLELKRATSP